MGEGGYLLSHILSGGGYLWYQVPSGVLGMSRKVGISMGWVCPGVLFPGVGMSRAGYPPDMGPEGEGVPTPMIPWDIVGKRS